MILGFDSGCPLPSLGSPRFDEEAVNRAKGGRSPRWIYSQSFSNKKLYSQSTQFFAFAPLIHNNIFLKKQLQVEMQAIHCKNVKRQISAFSSQNFHKQISPGGFPSMRRMKLILDLTGRARPPYMSLLWWPHRFRPGEESKSTQRVLTDANTAGSILTLGRDLNQPSRLDEESRARTLLCYNILCQCFGTGGTVYHLVQTASQNK